MNKSKLLLYILGMSLGVSAVSCANEKARPAETDELGIPLTVSQLIMGDSVSIDTLYVGEENVVRMINNVDYGQRLIFDSYGLLAYNPELEADSIAPDTYSISDLITSVEVNLSEAQGIDELKRIFPVYDDFKLVNYSTRRKTGIPALYVLSVSVPDESIACYEQLSRSVAATLDSLPFDGSFEILGRKMAGSFFEEYTEGPDFDNMSFFMLNNRLAYYKTPRFVTYFSDYCDYLGGAHGMYMYNFDTYLLENGERVTKEYLFGHEVDDQLRELIYEALAANDEFSTNNNIHTAAQAKRHVEGFIDQQLPLNDPGIVMQGVVFCYQPYEIACYAEGAFQLVIPTEKVLPLMTEKGKRLFR